MHAENFLIDQSSHRQSIENITENLPKSDGVSSLTLVIESINTVDLSTLVIASQKEEVLRILDFVAEKKGNGLDWLLASVDIVSEEEVVGLWWESPIFENPKKIVILTVHVSTDLDWGLKLKEVGLTKEDFTRLCAEIF